MTCEEITFNGKTVKDIIHNDALLNDFESEVENSTDFVEILRRIADIHHLVRADQLTPDFEIRIHNFSLQWDLVNYLYGLSYTLKIHIIEDHLA